MSLDLFAEIRDILLELEQRKLPYALAGAVALAIHGVVRATTDIDILVREDDLPAGLEAARDCGFDVLAQPVRFSDGMRIQRVSKIAGDETLTLDLLLVDENLESAWSSRLRVPTEFGEISVVSRAGLIAMKAWAGREQDLADIQKLREIDR